MTIFLIEFWLFLSARKPENIAFFLDKREENKYK